MAITLVQSTLSQGSQNSMTGVAAGNLVTEAVPYIISTGGSATPAMSDSSGQTYNADNVPTPQGATNAWLGIAAYSIPNANAGTHTPSATVTGSLSVSQIMCEWSGLPTTTSVDQTGVAGDVTTGTVTKTCTAGGATTVASELAVAYIAVQTNSGAPAALTDPPAGWTSIGVRQTWQGSNYGFEGAYKILSSTSTPSAAWSWTGAATTRNQSVLVTYKGFAAGNTLAQRRRTNILLRM